MKYAPVAVVVAVSIAIEFVVAISESISNASSPFASSASINIPLPEVVAIFSATTPAVPDAPASPLCVIVAKFLAVVSVAEEEIARSEPDVRELLTILTAVFVAADAVIPRTFELSVPLPTIVCFWKWVSAYCNAELPRSDELFAIGRRSEPVASLPVKVIVSVTALPKTEFPSTDKSVPIVRSAANLESNVP